MTYNQASNKLIDLLKKRNKTIERLGYNSNRLPELNEAIDICEKLRTLAEETEKLTKKLKTLDV
ncbi:hypothetical protein [Yeosuana marina]|uniref:hypothetical protein n=1 Tax=Yeosuana marina TaxID=1565536 RepID=UPI001420AE90|nr:hypothetical protein [Yeosuana marina]